MRAASGYKKMSQTKEVPMPESMIPEFNVFRYGGSNVRLPISPKLLLSVAANAGMYCRPRALLPGLEIDVRDYPSLARQWDADDVAAYVPVREVERLVGKLRRWAAKPHAKCRSWAKVEAAARERRRQRWV